MSQPARSLAAARDNCAPVFAALGDATRLRLVMKLSAGPPRSITQLTGDTALTRQAITKHLRILEAAGLVHSARAGRESRYALDPEPLDALGRYLARVSAEWDRTLDRLKSFVED